MMLEQTTTLAMEVERQDLARNPAAARIPQLAHVLGLLQHHSSRGLDHSCSLNGLRLCVSFVFRVFFPETRPRCSSSIAPQAYENNLSMAHRSI